MKYKNSNNEWIDLIFKPGGDTLPIGTIIPFGGESIPNGWLLCDGSDVSREEYAELFKVLETKFGSGDNYLTFTLPDFRGRNPIGANDKYILGTKGGEETHQLTVSEMPAHSHQLWNGTTGQITINGADGGNCYNMTYTYEKKVGGDLKATDTGGNQAHNNMQPYQVTNYIIKAYQIVANIAKVSNKKNTSDVDTYSCQYINNLITDVYSTEEQKTNEKWIDGKPLYRRTFRFIPTEAGEQLEFAHNIPDIDNVFINTNFTYILRSNGTKMYGIGNEGNDGYWFSARYVSKDNLKIGFKVGGAIYDGGIIFCTLEYTKITD